MHELYQSFVQIVSTENRVASLEFILKQLQTKNIDIVTLYEEVLTPALNAMDELAMGPGSIWKEHVRSSIVRTIIENCYLFVIKQRNEEFSIIPKKIAVACPAEEYHELGARMITDFFTLVGYEAYFVGSNTPKEEFLEILSSADFNYIALSVSNPFNLIAAKKTIDDIRATSPQIKILVGGNAFALKRNAYQLLGADRMMTSFHDIREFAKGDRL